MAHLSIHPETENDIEKIYGFGPVLSIAHASVTIDNEDHFIIKYCSKFKIF